MAALHRCPSQPERQHTDAVIPSAESRGGNKQWADLFRKQSKPSSAFQLRKWDADDRVIAKNELRNLGFCLVAYVLGKFPGRNAVEEVCKSWNVDSSCSLHDNGWLIFRFSSEQDRDLVLMKGPYQTFGAPWLLKKLPPFFKFTEFSFCSVPVWIRLRGLPLECWTEIALGKLASFVGEPLAADDCTATMAKSSFARILVEVDVSKPLVREIKTTLPDGSLLVQEVTYEREPQLCAKCRRIGHTEEKCRSISKRPQLKESQTSTEEAGMALQLPGVMGTAGNKEGKIQMIRAKGAPASSSSKHLNNKKQQLAEVQASTSSDVVADLVSSRSANEGLRQFDLQGASPSSPANLTGVTQMQAQDTQLASVQQLASMTGLEGNKPANQQAPALSKKQSSMNANTSQQRTELQGPSFSTAKPADAVSPQPANMVQRMVDLQGEASTQANPTAATQLQVQGLNLAHVQQKDATVFQETPVYVQESQTPACHRVVGQIKEQIPLLAKSEQTRRQTRSSSAAITADGATMLLQTSQHGPAANTDRPYELLHADQAEFQGVDPADHVKSMPRQQTQQKKWQTPKTKKGKRR